MAKTLLLADDSVTIQKVVGISFASEDIEITTVDNGDDAVARARELVPDIVLADAVMPGLSGYEVCEALKADPALSHIPVILLTGTFEAFDVDRAERAGAAGHVSKPFEAQTLVDRVKELLASAPPPAAAPVAEPEPAAAPSAPAFDFSDDDDFAQPALAGGDAELEAEPLDFDDSDAAFSFEEDDLSGALAAPVEPPPDATQLMPPVGAPAEEPIDPGDLAQATLLDPAAGSGYDVSSSDLGPPSGGEDPMLAALAARGGAPPPEQTPRPYGVTPLAEAPAPRAPALEPAAWESAAELEVQSAPVGNAPIEVAPLEDPAPFETEAEPLDASDVHSITDPFPEEPSPSAPLAAVAEERSPSAGLAGSAPVEAAALEPEVAPEPAEPEVAFEAAFATDEAWVEATRATGAEPSVEAVSATGAEASVRAVGDGAVEAGGGAALTPALRRELSDTLEKIAWDAFGPVTEKIVSQALARIEQVVWEVVPQIAETLIQEEIRRLKGAEDAE